MSKKPIPKLIDDYLTKAFEFFVDNIETNLATFSHRLEDLIAKQNLDKEDFVNCCVIAKWSLGCYIEQYATVSGCKCAGCAYSSLYLVECCEDCPVVEDNCEIIQKQKYWKPLEDTLLQFLKTQIELLDIESTQEALDYILARAKDYSEKKG